MVLMVLFNQEKILIAFSKHCTTLSNTGYMSALYIGTRRRQMQMRAAVAGTRDHNAMMDRETPTPSLHYSYNTSQRREKESFKFKFL